ncbi:transcriptional regulator FurA [Verrucomicrobiota bacterium]|nr:transcriptional regulator FurA [Verrucomicrobiota bacterium]
MTSRSRPSAFPFSGPFPATLTRRPTYSPRRSALKLGSISRQSVYNVLNVLTDKGIIRRIQPAESAALYEDRIGDNHHHLVCRTCGKTEDVCCAVGAAPCLTAHSHHGFKIDEAEVIYWGTCPACQKKKR